MGRFRHLIREGRRTLHEHMSVAALYYPWPFGGQVPRPITVRVHDTFLSLGDMKGAGLNFAERREVSPRAVFWCAEVIPERHMCFSTELGAVYRVDTVDAPDDVTTTAYVVRIGANEAGGRPEYGKNYLGGVLAFPLMGGADG